MAGGGDAGCGVYFAAASLLVVCFLFPPLFFVLLALAVGIMLGKRA